MLATDAATAYAALLELYTHEVLRERFDKVLYEPELPGTSHKPEFYASAKETNLIVECKFTLDKKPIRFAGNELEKLAKCLNKVRSRYSVSIQPQGLLDERITPRKVAAFLERELKKLSGPIGQDDTLTYQESPGSQPIKFLIMGQKEEDDDTIQSWWPTGDIAQTVTTDERIKNAIDEKASKYGDLGEPYLIVVWPKTQFPPGATSIQSALYGSRIYHIDRRPGVPARESAVPNGEFTRGLPGKPTCTRVSAVAIYRLYFHNRHQYEHRFAIFHNPYAECPLPTSIFLPIPQFIVTSESATGFSLDWLDGKKPEWWGQSLE